MGKSYSNVIRENLNNLVYSDEITVNGAYRPYITEADILTDSMFDIGWRYREKLFVGIPSVSNITAERVGWGLAFGGGYREKFDAVSDFTFSPLRMLRRTSGRWYSNPKISPYLEVEYEDGEVKTKFSFDECNLNEIDGYKVSETSFEAFKITIKDDESNLIFDGKIKRIPCREKKDGSGMHYRYNEKCSLSKGKYYAKLYLVNARDDYREEPVDMLISTMSRTVEFDVS